MTLIINRSTVSELLTIDDCIDAVEQAFKLWALNKAASPGILGIHAPDGGFHIKAGILELGKSYFVGKTNANFPKNRTLHGLPTIQGVVLVSDACNGIPLALMDSMEITVIRTGAATAVAAKYLARKDASVLTIVGCGSQGAISIKAICCVRPIRKVFLYDVDPVVANRLADHVRQESGIEAIVVDSIKHATTQSDIVVTCTPSTEPVLSMSGLSPGTFIAAVGCDSEGKNEIDPDVFAGSKIVVDSIDQCTRIGDLHHALRRGTVTKESVHAQLGEVIAGLKSGRETDDEIIIFDSTGTGLQDVAAASIVYERAAAKNIGLKFDFGS